MPQKATFQVKAGLRGDPDRVHVLVQDPAAAVAADFEFEVLAVGAARLVGLSFRAVRAGAELMLTDVRKHVPLGLWGEKARVLATAEAIDMRRSKLRGRPRPPLADGHRPYAAVAERYRDLVAAGLIHPGPVIAAELGVDATTIKNWLRRCRQLGLLPPAAGPGRATKVALKRKGTSERVQRKTQKGRK